MKTLVWVEHDNASLKDATLAAVTAAGKLGEVHLLVAGKGVIKRYVVELWPKELSGIQSGAKQLDQTYAQVQK